ncbi:acyltransferase family protein [Spongisporangium articulatum]|uniref:Acyltransferase family protein n=1 Tax=Spongisporangium articulatum TaxID=3362603 RepID=A0ABW8AT60_9ACTN
MTATTVILSTIRWDFVWQRHQALAVAAAARGPVTFVESQPRSWRQVANVVHGRLSGRRSDAGSDVRNARPDAVRLVAASLLALLLPRVWAARTARGILRAHPHSTSSGLTVLLYAPTPAYLALAARLERKVPDCRVVYDAVIDWTEVPAHWWPPRAPRAAEAAMPAHWKVTSDSPSLATVLETVTRRPVDVVLPAADPAFATFAWPAERPEGTIGWFGVVRDETDVDLLCRCAQAGLSVETIGPVEDPALGDRLRAAGVLVRPAVPPQELPAAIQHWRGVLCAYRGARAGTITPAKIFNALSGFRVFTRGLALPGDLSAQVVDLPEDDQAAVALIGAELQVGARTPALVGAGGSGGAPDRAGVGGDGHSWDDRLDQLTADRPEVAARESVPTPTIGSVAAARGRDNAANLLRLALAVQVIVYHGFLLGGFAERPELAFMSQIGVDGFFVVSGFLIAMSWERAASLPRYLWHRAVRILPGFWTCLILVAGLACLVAILEGTATQAFWTSPHNPLAYVTHNAFVQLQFLDIAGGPSGVPHPGEWNLSLWTLAWEAKAYLAVAVLGLLARRVPVAWRVLPVLALLGAMAVEAAEVVGGGEDRAQGVRFVGVFAAGMVMYVHRHRIPHDGRVAALAALVLGAGLLLLQDDYRAGALPALAYLTIWVAYRLREPGFLRHDLSYGVYIYAFPVGQLLAILGVQAAGYPVYVAATVAATLPVAALSWFGVERPALRLKSLELKSIKVGR